MSQPRRVKDGDIERPIELFEPWYYGETRPTITTAPEQVMVGESFQFTCASAGEIRRVAMLRAGSVTHGFDFDQRYVALRIERIAGDTITVSAPPTPDIIPPRLYQLIAVNARGSFSTSADRAAVGAVAAVSTALGVSAVYAVNTARHVCGTFCDHRTTPPGEMPKWKPWFEWQENVFSNYNAVTALSTKVNGTSLFTTGL